ncbi:unnamed protein product, partial [Brenthis ino]
MELRTVRVRPPSEREPHRTDMKQFHAQRRLEENNLKCMLLLLNGNKKCNMIALRNKDQRDHRSVWSIGLSKRVRGRGHDRLAGGGACPRRISLNAAPVSRSQANLPKCRQMHARRGLHAVTDFVPDMFKSLSRCLINFLYKTRVSFWTTFLITLVKHWL